MTEPGWALAALLAVGCLIAAAGTSGGLAIGWFVLGIAMGGVAYVRFQNRHRPGPDD